MSEKYTPPLQEEYAQVSEKIRSGEYFRESQNVYDASVQNLMAERYFYAFITIIACSILIMAIVAVKGLYPLQRSVPFIVSSEDLVEEMPNIKSLLVNKGDDVNEALMRFIVGNYVTLREEYSIENLDRNVSGIKAQSAPEIFDEFQRYINPANPDSPIKLYQRHTIKRINIFVIKILPEDDAYEAEVLFEAVLESKSGVKKSRWQANIAFNYSSIELDESTDKIKPLSFGVTKYSNKLLQDIK